MLSKVKDSLFKPKIGGISVILSNDRQNINLEDFMELEKQLSKIKENKKGLV